MNSKFACLVIAVASYASAAEIPPSVQRWQDANPNVTLVGWRYIRHEDQPAGIFLIKTIEQGAVYITESSEPSSSLFLSELRNYNLKTYGALDPVFAKQLVANRLYSVAVYPRVTVAEDNKFLPDPSSEVSEFLSAERNRVATETYTANKAVAVIIAQHGGEKIVVPEFAPFVIASLSGGQLLELRWNTQIDFIEPAAAHPVALYADDDAALKTVATRAVQNDVWWNQGITGLNRTIAIIEGPGIRNDLDYPATPDRWFSALVSRPDLGGWHAMSVPSGFASWKDSSSPDALKASKENTAHTNAVAAIAAGTFFEGSGAKAARLVSGNLTRDPAISGGHELVDLVRPAELTLGFFPSALNHSYGPDQTVLVDLPEPYNNAMDFRARQTRTLEVHACGNAGSFSVNDPKRSAFNRPAACNEYNTIKVGGYNDGKSIDWTNDGLAEKSQWVNPFVQFPGTILQAGDRELPEVLAPSVLVRSIDADWEQTNRSLTRQWGGTSLAAPNVAALATLFLDRFPGFATTPELVRAAVYATAVHNRFDGVRRSPPEFSYLTKVGGAYTADLKAGFGGVSGKALSLLVPLPGLGAAGQGHWERLVVAESDFVTLGGQTENKRYYSQCVVLGAPCQIENSRLKRIRPATTPALPYERLRVVLAWNSRLDCLQCTPNFIPKNAPIDFDMVVVDGLTNAPLLWNGASQTWGTGGPVTLDPRS